MRWRTWGAGVFAAGAVGLGGCASIPPLDNPVLVLPGATVEDPGYAAADQPTPEGYAEVYERALDALDDYFDVIPGSRHSGIIQTYPRTAPGYDQPWKPGTLDARERWLATLQSIRHTAVVRIAGGERGGFRVNVEVYKELEELPRPILAASAAAVFRDAAAADPKAGIIGGPTSAEPNWMPAGKPPHRDYAFEQAILRKIQRPATLK